MRQRRAGHDGVVERMTHAGDLLVRLVTLAGDQHEVTRGGLTDRAWTQRVLVVRGSLDHPETFKVNVSGALTGDMPNLELKPGDIIYVGNRPWIRAEELLDRAASAFVEAAVVIDLPALGGSARLKDAGVPGFALLAY